MKATKYIGLVLALALAGCSANAAPATTTTYKAVLPYETSDTRTKHVGLISDDDVRTEVERGLMDLSEAHFSPDDVSFKTHAFLTYDELDATDGSQGLLGTLRDDNPNGLNPNNNEAFDTGNGMVQGGIILADLYELDWYKADKLAGISIALVVNDEIEKNGQVCKIGDEQMRSYLEFTSNKLVSYMRERFNDVPASVPILIAAYELDSDDPENKGGYMYEGWFSANNNTGKFSEVNEKTVIVPGDEFSELDPELAAEFNTFREDVRSVLIENTYVTGTCRFLDDKPTYLDLTITTHRKMYAEVLAAAQACEEKMSTFTNTDITYHVLIVNNNKTCAAAVRPAGSNTLQVVTTQ